MMQFLGWCVCFTKFLSHPLLFQMGEWMNLRGIRFSIMCENRDMSSEFDPLMLVGSVTFEMKDAHKIDLVGRPGWFKSFVL